MRKERMVQKARKYILADGRNVSRITQDMNNCGYLIQRHAVAAMLKANPAGVSEMQADRVIAFYERYSST